MKSKQDIIESSDRWNRRFLAQQERERRQQEQAKLQLDRQFREKRNALNRAIARHD